MIMAGVKFDATLNLGHVATICAILVGGGAAYTSLDGRIASVEKQVVDIPDIKTLVRQQQVQIEALGKQDDIFRESMRRMSDYLSQIAKDTAEIKGRLAAEKAETP
jgi:hypothetical protein